MFFEYLNLMLQSPQLLLLIELISCAIKIYLLFFLITTSVKSLKIQRQLILLLTILACGLIVDFSWVLALIREIKLFNIDFRIVLFIIRCAWAINFVLYLALGFFIESLCQKHYTLKIRHTISLFLGAAWVAYFSSIAIFQYNIININDRVLEQIMLQAGIILLPFLLVVPSLYVTISLLQNNHFPKILKKQIIILITYLIFPYLVTQLMDFFSIYYKQFYILIGLSNSFLAFAIYFSISKIIKLRFLNFSTNIQSPQKIAFIKHFKTFLANIAKAKSFNEINFIVKNFLKDSLEITSSRITLYYRHNAFETRVANNEMRLVTQEEAVVERLINHPIKNDKILECMRNQQILIYDEIEFTHFYQDEIVHKEILHFMNELKADVFLPIYEQNNLIAYLIINSTSSENKHELFSNFEYDQMVILGSYLGHIISLLHLNNYKELIAQNKLLNEHLYQTHQENNQYRESIQSFLRDNLQRQMGILFYKNYHFSFGNQAAKELIPININVFDGHPITKALKKLVKQTQEYKTNQSTTVYDAKGNPLVLTALSHLEKNTIIITITHPEVSDIIKQQANNLRNPSEWEYLLYLQTTNSGKLINKLIPGSNRLLLNFKIEILRASLSKKAALLDVPEDDLEPTAEILHHISLRENLHKLTMNSLEKNGTIAAKLFGVNPLFGTFEQALLEQLNNHGTLFIQNIHLLELSTQEALAEFIKYGYYTVCKSNKRVFADVRIICSTSQNLQTLMQEGKFAKSLFEELNKMTVSMPSLFNLTQQELDELIKEFSQQEISDAHNFQKLLEFTSRDKEQLMKARSMSLSGLRKKINQILVEKSKKHEIYHDVTFDPASHIADPELAEAARLGKNALRDRKKLVMLMEKFNYNQNKVAAFLGVNRSSINRRLKAYKIEVYHDNHSDENCDNEMCKQNIQNNRKHEPL